MPQIKQMGNGDAVWEDEEEISYEETSEDEYDEDLSEVESRLEEANCYKALLRGPLFGPDSPAVAEKVEAEVKEFIRGRLAFLLGLQTISPVASGPAPTVFNEEEVSVLKTWAAVLKGRPHLMNPKPSEPQVNVAKVESKPQEVTRATVNQPVSVNTPANKTRKPRTRKTKEETNLKKKEPENIITEVINGVEVKVDLNKVKRRQTLPSPSTPGYIPPLDPEQSAMYMERNAMVNAPTGMIGLAAHIASNSGDE